MATSAASPRTLRQHGAALECANAGSLTDVEVEPIYERWLVQIAQRLASAHRLGLADGWVIAVLYQPMPDGGWVATLEYVTEWTQADATRTGQAPGRS